MLVIFKQVAVMLIFAIVGCFMAKKKIIDPDQGSILSRLAVYIFLPCATFNSFATNFTVKYFSEKYMLILVALALLIVVSLISHWLAKKLQPNGYDRLVYEYSMIIPNVSYVGYPMILSLFGSEALLDVIVFTLPMNVYCFTLGYDMLTEQMGQKISLKRLFPPVVIAMLLGAAVGLSGLKMPAMATQVTESAAACLGPVGMLLLGIAMAKFELKDLFTYKQVYIVTAMRLVVFPAAVFAVLKLLRLDYMLLPAIVTYAMPCGLNAIIFPQMTGHDCTRGAALVLISTVLCVITVPICVYLFV